MYVSMVVCPVARVTLRLSGLHSSCTNSVKFSFVPSPQLRTFLPHTKGKEYSVHYVSIPWEESLALDAKKNKSKAQSNEWVGCNKPPSLSKPGFRYQSSIFGHCGHHNTSLVTASASDTSSVLSWRTCVC